MCYFCQDIYVISMYPERSCKTADLISLVCMHLQAASAMAIVLSLSPAHYRSPAV